jgi:choloylglycine hydrolase
MKKNVVCLIGMAVSILGGINAAQACTDFRTTAKDGTVLIARSMEFAADLKSNLCTSPRGRVFNNTAPTGKPGLSWKAKYGYLYLNGFNIDGSVDGMNEQGLSFGALYLPGETQYQVIPSGQENRALPYTQFGDWVLSNFKTVDEVKKVLPNVLVFAQKLPVTGNMIFPLHASIYDATGKGLVVEFIKGKVNVYENHLGILTNSPTYDWHLTNLRNYLNLTPLTPTPILTKGITFAATGQGAGMVGLPGDVSPPSRFVKVAIMQQTVFPVANAMDALNLAGHIMNNVDIPLGFVREAKTGRATNEYTQWVIFKDLTHKNIYFRTYHNSALRAVSLANLNFSENAPRLKMSIETPFVIQDVTSQFK